MSYSRSAVPLLLYPCIDGSGLQCNCVGDIFFPHFEPLSTNWPSFKPQSLLEYCCLPCPFLYYHSVPIFWQQDGLKLCFIYITKNTLCTAQMLSWSQSDREPVLEEEIASASEGGSPQYYEGVPNKVALSHSEKSYIHSYFFKAWLNSQHLRSLTCYFIFYPQNVSLFSFKARPSLIENTDHINQFRLLWGSCGCFQTED